VAVAPRQGTNPGAKGAAPAGFRLDCYGTQDLNGVEANFCRISVFKNGWHYHYEFKLDGVRRRGSTGTANKQQAIQEERRQRERLEKSYSQVIDEESREQQRKTIEAATLSMQSPEGEGGSEEHQR